ncbi:MAG: VTC domain-containing protein [Candidatus Rokuibacteriota bacterium]
MSDPTREAFAAAWLAHACRRDPRYAAASVTSIYYDTLGLDGYREKLNGDFIKTKVRVRWYDAGAAAPPDAPVFLELKRRVGGGRTKLRTRLPVERAGVAGLSLEDPRLRELPYRAAPEFLPAVPADLHPILTVRFERRRFVCPASGARVSLDTDIRATDGNGTLLPALAASRLVGAPVGVVVVEVKGPWTGDPFWLAELYRAGYRLRPFSKYAACLARLLSGAAA